MRPGAAGGPDLFTDLIDGSFGILEVRFESNPGCNLIQTPIAAAPEVAAQFGDLADEIDDLVTTTFQQAQAYPGCDNLGPFDRVINRTRIAVDDTYTKPLAMAVQPTAMAVAHVATTVAVPNAMVDGGSDRTWRPRPGYSFVGRFSPRGCLP